MQGVDRMNHQDVPVPPLLRDRPRDERGFLVTYVTFIDPQTKKPDFRIIDHKRVVSCIKWRMCGLCGKKIDKFCAFIGGNESVANRIFSDPPMHYDCAKYATQVCPYLARENARRRQPEVHDGFILVENPLAGVERPERMAVYVCRDYEGILVAKTPGEIPTPCIKVGKPTRIEWF